MTRSTSLTCVAAALLAVCAPALHAQNFHLTGGGDLPPLVTLPSNHFVGGLDADASGDLFYIDVDGSFSGPNTGTHLIERTVDGVSHDLFDLSANQAVYGSFVRLHGSEVFWGETSTNTLYRATLKASAHTLQNVSAFGQIGNNYDLAFDSTGTAMLVASPGSFSNTHAYKLNLATTGTITISNGATSKLDTGGQSSGPIAFDASGRLYYGSSNGGIYRYSAAETANSTEFTLDAQHLLLSNATNAYLAFGATGTLYQDAGNTLTGYNLSNGTSSFTIGSADSGFYLGNIATGNGSIYVTASNFADADYIYAVPEPAPVTMLALAAVGVLSARRRRV